MSAGTDDDTSFKKWMNDHQAEEWRRLHSLPPRRSVREELEEAWAKTSFIPAEHRIAVVTIVGQQYLTLIEPHNGLYQELIALPSLDR